MSMKNATGNLLIADSFFEFNSAGDDAGHVQTETTGSVTIRRSTFNRGFSNDKGGALVLQNTAQTIEGSTFQFNTAGCTVTAAPSKTPRTMTCAACVPEVLKANSTDGAFRVFSIFATCVARTRSKKTITGRLSSFLLRRFDRFQCRVVTCRRAWRCKRNRSTRRRKVQTLDGPLLPNSLNPIRQNYRRSGALVDRIVERYRLGL